MEHSKIRQQYYAYSIIRLTHIFSDHQLRMDQLWMMTNVYYFSSSSIPLVSHCDFGHTAPPAPEQNRTSLTKLPKYLGNSCSGPSLRLCWVFCVLFPLQGGATTTTGWWLSNRQPEIVKQRVTFCHFIAKNLQVDHKQQKSDFGFIQ